MTPKTPFNKWIVDKILSYLASKEGCVIEDSIYTQKGMKAVVMDTFGFRYEIEIKTLSRLNDEKQDSNALCINFQKAGVLDLSKLAFKTPKE